MAKVVAILDTRGLDRIMVEHEPKAAQIIKGAAFAVQGKAATLAPVDTGALKNSISAEEKSALTWWVVDGVEYGIYQELGFHHYASGAFIQNAFMVPAVEWVRPQFMKQWRQVLR